MRTGAAADHLGFFHETAFYGSDEEFLAIVLPFLTGGLGAGEPVVVAFAPANEDLVRQALGAATGVTYISNETQYARPANAIGAYRRMLADYVSAGARQVRIVGDVPHPGLGVPWDWWGRYESVVNVALDDFPLWGLCPYDTRITPGPVLDHVRRTHPHIATSRGSMPNADFGTPTGAAQAWHDPIERTQPAVVLVDPLPSTARAAIAMAGRVTNLSDDDVSGLMLAVTEALSNGVMHGRAPTRLRLWAAPDRIVVTVTDQGPGPTDPMIGLVPVRPAGAGAGGQGLWLAHQVCSYVTLETDAMGFTVRMIAGRVPSP